MTTSVPVASKAVDWKECRLFRDLVKGALWGGAKGLEMLISHVLPREPISELTKASFPESAMENRIKWLAEDEKDEGVQRLLGKLGNSISELILRGERCR